MAEMNLDAADFNMSGTNISKDEKDKAQKILDAVVKLPENRHCADCSALGNVSPLPTVLAATMFPLIHSCDPSVLERYKQFLESAGSTRSWPHVAQKAQTDCAWCRGAGPRWASMNLGILVCLNCSGIHRRLGVHISKVKSVTLDGWKVKWAQVLPLPPAPAPHPPPSFHPSLFVSHLDLLLPPFFCGDRSAQRQRKGET